MVGPDLIDCIYLSLRKVKGNDRPFGGVPIIMVGDTLQLPPVVRDKEVGVYFTHFYESPYVYSAKVFEHMEIYPVELKRVFRQSDEGFVEALDAALSRCRTMGGIILSRPLDLSDVQVDESVLSFYREIGLGVKND